MREVGCTIQKTIRLLHVLWVSTGISDVLCLRLLAWLSDLKVGKFIFSRSMKGKRAVGDEVNKTVTMRQILFLKFSYFLIRWSEILCVSVCISLSLSHTHTHTDTHREYVFPSLWQAGSSVWLGSSALKKHMVYQGREYPHIDSYST